MKLIERAPLRVHERVLLPGLGDHHHDRLRDGVARHHEQLQAVIKRGGIGLAGIDHRIELGEILAEHRRAHHALARAKPVVVTLDRVDFAVVRNHPVGVGKRPLGESVGGKALMHQCEG